MFGISPPSVRQDPLQLFGRALGMERLVELNDRNIQIDDYNTLEEYDYKQMVKQKFCAPGTKVVRVRHNKFSKMDSHYKPEVFMVVASFNNGTCQLADFVGRHLKRRVNLSSLRQIHQKGSLVGGSMICGNFFSGILSCLLSSLVPLAMPEIYIKHYLSAFILLIIILFFLIILGPSEAHKIFF